jgi:hypothetical protein
MPTIDWPDTPQARPATIEWTQMLPEANSSSVFNQSTQSLVLGPAYWMVTIGIGSRRRSEVADAEALLDLFLETRTRIRLWDWRREAPRGTGAGVPLVKGAGQSGKNILTDGWTPSQNVLLAADWVGVGGELRRVTGIVASSVAGEATLTLDQPVRASPADNSPIVITKPKSLFICTTDKKARGFLQDGARMRGPTLEFMEVFSE